LEKFLNGKKKRIEVKGLLKRKGKKIAIKEKITLERKRKRGIKIEIK